MKIVRIITYILCIILFITALYLSARYTAPYNLFVALPPCMVAMYTLGKTVTNKE